MTTQSSSLQQTMGGRPVPDQATSPSEETKILYLKQVAPNLSFNIKFDGNSYDGKMKGDILLLHHTSSVLL